MDSIINIYTSIDIFAHQFLLIQFEKKYIFFKEKITFLLKKKVKIMENIFLKNILFII